MPLSEISFGSRRIERYGAGGFRISGEAWRGSVIILPDRILSWAPASAEAVTPEDLAPLIAARDEFQFVLFGLGKGPARLRQPLREALAAAGVRSDPMDTGAACRTYNVLVAEERLVAAALIAID